MCMAYQKYQLSWYYVEMASRLRHIYYVSFRSFKALCAMSQELTQLNDIQNIVLQ